MMTCELFARLLDETGGEGMPEAAFAHAARCARCTNAFADARALERVLASGGGDGTTGARFTDDSVERIMARVAVTPQVRVAPVAAPRSSWRDMVSLPVLASALSGLALLALAAGAGFDPVRITELLTPSLPQQSWPEWSLSGPDASYVGWALAGSVAAIAMVASWWIRLLWGEDRARVL